MKSHSAAFSSSDASQSEDGVRPERAEDAPPSATGAEVTKELLLVVDDDASVLQVASKVLQRGGYEVLSAGGGAEAIALAEANEERISLLLTDVVMPGMGGRELSEIFRSRFPSVRILFMSAYTEDEVILQGVRVAEVDFISKPFTVQGLQDKVRDVINRNGTHSSAASGNTERGA